MLSLKGLGKFRGQFRGHKHLRQHTDGIQSVKAFHHMRLGALYKNSRHGFAHRPYIDLLLAALIKAGLQIHKTVICKPIFLPQPCKQGNSSPHPRRICLLVRHRRKEQVSGCLRIFQHLLPKPVHDGKTNGKPAFHVIHSPAEQPLP